ncbi:MAG: hypothetical protein V1756_00720 [Patescibacteria group bacterium]
MLTFFKNLFKNFGRIANKKGISIYLALLIMGILLAITLGLNSILVGQIKTIRGIGYSVVAFYTAETGIETALFSTNCTSTCEFSDYLDLNSNSVQDEEDSVYFVSGMGASENGCPVGVNYCIKSIGVFKETKRALQISR